MTAMDLGKPQISTYLGLIVSRAGPPCGLYGDNFI